MSCHAGYSLKEHQLDKLVGTHIAAQFGDPALEILPTDSFPICDGSQ
jgi:hypothetical protein